MDCEIVARAQKLEQLGNDRYKSFVEQRLVSNVKTITDKVPRTKTLIFKGPPKAQRSKIKQEIQNLKSDCSLFSRMYISCQSRDGDLDDFFKHENLSYPNHYQMEGN